VTRAINSKIKKIPTVDLTSCSQCGGCLEVAPQIFRFSESGGYIEVCDLDLYDECSVDEAIKFCPENSIEWEEIR
jgi:ferredoxin